MARFAYNLPIRTAYGSPTIFLRTASNPLPCLKYPDAIRSIPVRLFRSRSIHEIYPIMEAGGNEISRLSEELLALILSRTSPPDAGRCAAVSRAFLAAADSDAVWSCFLPRYLPQLAKSVLHRAPPSENKKGLFRRLSDQPALLPDKLVVRSTDPMHITSTQLVVLLIKIGY